MNIWLESIPTLKVIGFIIVNSKTLTIANYIYNMNVLVIKS